MPPGGRQGRGGSGRDGLRQDGRLRAADPAAAAGDAAETVRPCSHSDPRAGLPDLRAVRGARWVEGKIVEIRSIYRFDLSLLTCWYCFVAAGIRVGYDPMMVCC